jgi:hypothetical protein
MTARIAVHSRTNAASSRFGEHRARRPKLLARRDRTISDAGAAFCSWLSQ